MDLIEIVIVFAVNCAAIMLSLWLVSAIAPLRGLATVLARRVIDELRALQLIP